MNIPETPNSRCSDSRNVEIISIKMNNFHFQYIMRFLHHSLVCKVSAIIPGVEISYNNDESSISINRSFKQFDSCDSEDCLENCTNVLREMVDALVKPTKVSLIRCIDARTLLADETLCTLEARLGVMCCIPPEVEQLLSLKLLFLRGCPGSSWKIVDWYLQGLASASEVWPSEGDTFGSLKVQFISTRLEKVMHISKQLGVVFSTSISYNGGMYCSLIGREEYVALAFKYLENLCCLTIPIPPHAAALCMDFVCNMIRVVEGCGDSEVKRDSPLQVRPPRIVIPY